jgi:hypothetical protein
MNDHDPSKAARDVIATTDSYGGPVSQDELAEVYLAPGHQGKDEVNDRTDEDATTPGDPAPDI